MKVRSAREHVGADLVGALGLVVGAEGGRLFLGVGDAAALADAEDVDLALALVDLAGGGFGGGFGGVGPGFGLVRVDGVAHGLAVNGNGLVVDAAVGVEALQGEVELGGVDAHQDVADDVLAGAS